MRANKFHRHNSAAYSGTTNQQRCRALFLTSAILLGLACLFNPGIIMPVHAADAGSAGGKLYFGLEYSGAPDMTYLQRREAELQHGASLVLWYQDWVMADQQQAFPVAQMDSVRVHGSIPVLAWYPMDGTKNSATQPAFTLAKIINGSWDAYIRQYAAQVKAWGHPFFLRFASEMNGSWIPWSEMSNGNQTGQFVQAWRHVYNIFSLVGVKNATWTWCPNTEDSTTTPLDRLYPGNAYVDWACMDGYNFSVDLNGAPWRTFSQVFRGSYQHLLALIPPTMPIMIGEMGSVEHGGSKPDWIKDALSLQLPSQYPRIKGVIWFDSTNPGIDLRIDTSPQSLAAMRTALTSGAYADNSYRYLDQSPIPAAGVVGANPSTPSVYHDASTPAAGYVQVLDSAQKVPLPNARLVFAGASSPRTDARGNVAIPGDAPQVSLEAIGVSGGVMAMSLALDRRLGYQIQVDLTTGKVISVHVHDPMPMLAPPKPPSPLVSAVAALKSAPPSLTAMIVLAALTSLITIIITLRLSLRLWRRRARPEKAGNAASKPGARVEQRHATR